MSDEKTNVRICKKCLLKEFNEQEYYDKLDKYITGLDAAIRADDELYQSRLTTCKECDKLSEGTCLGCGCFVELRAAVKKSRCPYKKW